MNTLILIIIISAYVLSVAYNIFEIIKIGSRELRSAALLGQITTLVIWGVKLVKGN